MFPSAVGLYPFGDVSVMGVGVGTVDAVEIDDDHVRVEMTIDHGIPLPADVQATIEPLTLIGERNVVLFPPWDAEMAEAEADKAAGRRRHPALPHQGTGRARRGPGGLQRPGPQPRSRRTWATS